MPFYVCTKFETKILSLTEVIVVTRNGLHTYIHTYMHTYIHTYTQTFFIRYLSSACSKTNFSTKIFARLQYTYLIKSNRYNNRDKMFQQVKNSPNNEMLKLEYIKYRTMTTSLIKKTKINYYREKINQNKNFSKH